MLCDQSSHNRWKYAWLAFLTPAVVAVPVLGGNSPNAALLVAGGSVVMLLALGGWRNLQTVVVVIAYALPCLLGAPWPIHCITAAIAWYSWRIFGGGHSTRLRCRIPGWVTVGRGALAVLCGFICGGVVIILDWVRIVDLGLVLPVSKPVFAFIPLAVATIAAVNSMAEELFWREVLLDLTGGSVWRRDVLIFQAVSFGLAHLNGVPSGVVGAVASGIFSILLVTIRIRWGFGLAVIVHFAANLVIFSVIAQFAHYGNSGIFLA